MVTNNIGQSGCQAAPALIAKPQSFTAATAEYERTADAKLLVRDPALADRNEISRLERLADEVHPRQAEGV